MSRVSLAKYFGALGRLQSYVSLDGKGPLRFVRVRVFLVLDVAVRRSFSNLHFPDPHRKQFTDRASQFPLTQEMRSFLSSFESTFQHALVAPAASLPSSSTLANSHPPPSSSVDSAPSVDAKRLQEAEATITALER